LPNLRNKATIEAFRDKLHSAEPEGFIGAADAGDVQPAQTCHRNRSRPRTSIAASSSPASRHVTSIARPAPERVR